MQNITNYQIVTTWGTQITACSDLAQRVKELISEGWQPSGGVSFYIMNADLYCCAQSMVS